MDDKLWTLFGMIAMYVIGLIMGGGFGNETGLKEELINLIDQKNYYIGYLECEADIYGDTWRESDCGIVISNLQEELGTCKR